MEGGFSWSAESRTKCMQLNNSRDIKVSEEFKPGVCDNDTKKSRQQDHQALLKAEYCPQVEAALCTEEIHKKTMRT